MESILEYVGRPDLKPLFDTIVEFNINALPKDVQRESPDSGQFTVRVVRKGPDSYAVMHNGEVYDSKLRSNYEPLPSERSDAFKRRYRFPLPEAIALAEKLAPTVKLMRYDVEGFTQWWYNKRAELAESKSL